MPDYFNSGFTVGQPAWHNLSFVPERNPQSLDELLEWTFCYNSKGKVPDAEVWEPEYSGLLTTASNGRCGSQQEECREPAVYRVNGREDRVACQRHATVAAGKGASIEPLPVVVNEGWQAVKRSDNGHLLHVSKTSFEVFQNREAAELLMRVLEYDFDNHEELKLKFETGIVLKDGGLVVFCVSMDMPEEIPGDPSPMRPYSSVHNYHDGSGALRVQNTGVREVCFNTASAAEMEADKSGRTFSFRHSKNLKENVAEAIEALKNGRKDVEKWVRYASEAVMIPVEDSQFEDFLQDFMPEPPAATKRVKNNVMNARQSLRKIYTTSPTCEGIRGSAWGVISATIEYLDHHRTYRTPETYVSRTMLKPEAGKLKAMELIGEIVGYEHSSIMEAVSN